MSPPTFVVSLPGSHRRAIIETELKRIDLPFEFSDGVLLPVERVEYLKLWLRARFSTQDFDEAASLCRLTQGSLGTLLAYLALFQSIATSTHDFAIVLEDDCRAHGGLKFAHIDWNELRASCGNPMFLFLHKCPYSFGMVAQLVTREGAQTVLENIDDVLRSSLPIDLYVWQRSCITRCSLFQTTGAWMFEHVAPINHTITSERMTINRVYGHTGDYVR